MHGLRLFLFTLSENTSILNVRLCTIYIPEVGILTILMEDSNGQK